MISVTHINQYLTQFTIYKIGFNWLKFCQKGDSIDRLIDYLIQNGIGNYKLAFGLYGATRGFASLPKTFTSALINGDKEYFKEPLCKNCNIYLYNGYLKYYKLF